MRVLQQIWRPYNKFLCTKIKTMIFCRLHFLLYRKSVQSVQQDKNEKKIQSEVEKFSFSVQIFGKCKMIMFSLYFSLSLSYQNKDSFFWVFPILGFCPGLDPTFFCLCVSWFSSIDDWFSGIFHSVRSVKIHYRVLMNKI